MNELRYTLLSEGTSDKALLPILNWLLRLHLPTYAIQPTWADLGRLPDRPKTLADKIECSLRYYPCDVLFIHRDTDNQGRSQRIEEIDRAISNVRGNEVAYSIPVIPIRMTEAWLLFDESAIRLAADNPKGNQTLSLPKLKAIESKADPKMLLHDLLREASGVSGRRLKQFNARLSDKVQRISDITNDFSPLRALSAFQLLEAEVCDFAQRKASG